MNELERTLSDLASAPGSLERPRGGADCPGEDVIAALALGRLAPAEERALRRHLADCGACTADALAAIEEARLEGALGVTDGPGAARTAARRLPRLVLLACAAAAALLLFVARPWDRGGPDRADAVALARIEPLPVRIPRGPGDPVELALRAGLERYAEADYAAALDRLADAAARAPERADAALYLGSTELLLGRPERAKPALERAAAADGALGAEARWQLAQAHLALGEVAEARARLARLAEQGGARAGDARAQLERLGP